MGFADENRKKEKETKEAVEGKANEYAELKKEVENFKKSNENLTDEIADLKEKIGGLKDALKGITPAKIEEVQKAGEKVFEPLKRTVIKLNDEIKEAGRKASYRVRNAGEKSLQEYLLQGAVTAVWYALITFVVMRWGIGMDEIKTNVKYTVDKVKVIHYNQTTGQQYGTYDMWHMDEFYDKLDELKKQREAMVQQQQNSN